MPSMIGGLRGPGALQRAHKLSMGTLMPPTAAALASRSTLDYRKEKWCQPELTAAAEMWWKTCCEPERQVVSQEAYTRLNVLLYRALVPAVWDIERATECAMEDWNLDGGGSEMRQEQFYASLGELAEAWSPKEAVPQDPSAAARRDAAWLNAIFEVITRLGGDAGAAMLRELHEVQCITTASAPPVASAPSPSPPRLRSRQASRLDMGAKPEKRRSSARRESFSGAAPAAPLEALSSVDQRLEGSAVGAAAGESGSNPPSSRPHTPGASRPHTGGSDRSRAGSESSLAARAALVTPLGGTRLSQSQVQAREASEAAPPAVASAKEPPPPPSAPLPAPPNSPTRTYGAFSPPKLRRNPTAGREGREGREDGHEELISISAGDGPMRRQRTYAGDAAGAAAGDGAISALEISGGKKELARTDAAVGPAKSGPAKEQRAAQGGVGSVAPAPAASAADAPPAAHQRRSRPRRLPSKSMLASSTSLPMLPGSGGAGGGPPDYVSCVHSYVRAVRDGGARRGPRDGGSLTGPIDGAEPAPYPSPVVSHRAPSCSSSPRCTGADSGTGADKGPGTGAVGCNSGTFRSALPSHSPRSSPTRKLGAVWEARPPSSSYCSPLAPVQGKPPAAVTHARAAVLERHPPPSAPPATPPPGSTGADRSAAAATTTAGGGVAAVSEGAAWRQAPCGSSFGAAAVKQAPRPPQGSFEMTSTTSNAVRRASNRPSRLGHVPHTSHPHTLTPSPSPPPSHPHALPVTLTLTPSRPPRHPHPHSLTLSPSPTPSPSHPHSLTLTPTTQSSKLSPQR